MCVLWQAAGRLMIGMWKVGQYTQYVYVWLCVCVSVLWLLWQAAGMMIGMWKVGQYNIKRRGWKQEKVDARRSLAPYLQVFVLLL